LEHLLTFLVAKGAWRRRKSDGYQTTLPVNVTNGHFFWTAQRRR
jgi:hypothetical protein